MKVCIITANWGKGGPGGIAADLYNSLKKNGADCLLAYGRESVPADINSYKIGTKLGIYGHVFMARLFDRAGFSSNLATRKLIKKIDKYKPDIISIQNPLGYVMNVGMLLQYIKKSGIQTVWTLHDCWAFSGHCTTDICDRIFLGCGNCPHKREFPKSLFIDNSAYNLKKKQKLFSNIPNLHFVAPSNWIGALAKRSFLGQNEIVVINNGIDLTIFRPTESNLRKEYNMEHKTILLAVASVWSKRKGVTYLYELMRFLDASFNLVIIGKIDLPEKNDERIIYIEKTEDREELAAWYTAADVFLNPTIGDNFPTVNLESLACGTPVVTFATGGSAESVGECGISVEPRNILKMKEAIIQCISNRISPEKCINHAQLFDRNKRYNDYIKYFEQLIV